MDVKIGGTYEIGTDVTVLNLTEPTSGNSPQRGTLVHRLGGSPVYVQMNADDVDANEDAGEGKFWLVDGESWRIPKGCTKLALKCASGSAKVHYLEA